MAYINKISLAGNVAFGYKYHSWRYKSEKRYRKENYKPTSEQQKAINERIAEEKIVRYAIENFEKGDKFVRLSYPEGNTYPSSFEEADKRLTSFLKKLKRKYPELKYIANTELGSRGGLHHHLLIPEDFSLDIILKEWYKHCGGGHSVKEIYSEDIVQLASYLTKGSLDEQISGDNKEDYAKLQREHSKVKKIKTHKSKNLRKPPKPIKKRCRADSWTKEPKTQVIGDYIYDLKPGSVKTGFTTEGYPYQSYILIRREPKNRKRKSGSEKCLKRYFPRC